MVILKRKRTLLDVGVTKTKRITTLWKEQLDVLPIELICHILDFLWFSEPCVKCNSPYTKLFISRRTILGFTGLTESNQYIVRKEGFVTKNMYKPPYVTRYCCKCVIKHDDIRHQLLFPNQIEWEHDNIEMKQKLLRGRMPVKGGSWANARRKWMKETCKYQSCLIDYLLGKTRTYVLDWV